MKKPTYVTWYAIAVNNHLVRILGNNPGMGKKEAIVMAIIRAKLDGFRPHLTK